MLPGASRYAIFVPCTSLNKQSSTAMLQIVSRTLFVQHLLQITFQNTSKFRITGPLWEEFIHKGPVMRQRFHAFICHCFHVMTSALFSSTGNLSWICRSLLNFKRVKSTWEEPFECFNLIFCIFGQFDHVLFQSKWCLCSTSLITSMRPFAFTYRMQCTFEIQPTSNTWLLVEVNQLLIRFDRLSKHDISYQTSMSPRSVHQY